MTKIKICGITNIEDALVAAEAGADALGFVFAESPRRVEPKQVARIVAELLPFILRIGVFVGASASEVLSIADECGLDGVQLHGDDDLQTEIDRDVRVIRVVRVREEKDVALAKGVKADGILLDSKIEGILGGTGHSFDWSLLDAASFASPLILSGGLNPQNVGKAIDLINPYAVDTSSGVEERPGKKNHEAVRAFIRAVRLADQSDL